MPAARRRPSARAPEVQGSVGHQGGCRDRHKIDREAQQPLIEGSRQTSDNSGSQPGRENRNLFMLEAACCRRV